MFLGQIFAKNAKNDPKTLFEASKSVKKQNSVNHGKVPKWRESACFFTCFILYLSHFWRYRLEILYTFMRYCPLTYVTFFENFDLGGNCFEKKKNGPFLKSFQNFHNFENPRYEFCSPTNYTSFHVSQLIVALKLHQCTVGGTSDLASQDLSTPITSLQLYL